jgi:hypothetical protein
MRQSETLRKISGPFDPAQRTVDVRDIRNGEGHYNIKSLGILLWRLRAWPLTGSPAMRVDARRFLFNPLGLDTQLLARPQTVDGLDRCAMETNVPNLIGRELLRNHLKEYLGEDRSLNVEVGGQNIVDIYGKDLEDLVEVCDLSGPGTEWRHLPRRGRLAIDPVLGRIAFGDDQASAPRVSFHYGFSAAMGGGEYNRPDSVDWVLRPVVKADGTIQQALDRISSGTEGGAVEIPNSQRYEEPLAVRAPAGRRVELRAANQNRPLIVLPNHQPFEISGGQDAVVTLSGLIIGGGTILVPQTHSRGLRLLRLRHCTLVPGLTLRRDGSPQNTERPSLVLELPNISVEIDHCIIGALQVKETANLWITDSIIDATSPERLALAGPGGGPAPRALAISRSTVFGKICVHSLELAENCIFTGEVFVANRQSGCVRFCYLPLESKTPRRYECQPDLVQRAAAQTIAETNEANVAKSREGGRVRPQFDSMRFGDPSYCRLSQACAKEIRQGADDEAEMGAFHDLYQPQREAALSSRLAGYVPFGLKPGTIYVT